MSKATQDAHFVVPRHVAIIMDGNNRWAKKRFLPGVAGHKAGVDAVRAVVEVCAESGVEVLTLFAFSSENWQRPASEVGALMELFLVALRREAKKLDQNGIRLRIIGDRSRFHPELQAAMQEAEQRTAHHSKFLLLHSLTIMIVVLDLRNESWLIRIFEHDQFVFELQYLKIHCVC